MTFEEEPSNPYDSNAIMIVCRGEGFGTMGYVGREYTLKIKELLKNCELYRIDIKDGFNYKAKEQKLIIKYTLPSRQKNEKSGWGGYRPGSGRKPIHPNRRGHSVYVTDQEWEKVQTLIKHLRNGEQSSDV